MPGAHWFVERSLAICTPFIIGFGTCFVNCATACESGKHRGRMKSILTIEGDSADNGGEIDLEGLSRLRDTRSLRFGTARCGLPAC